MQDSVLYPVLLPEARVGAGQCTVHCTVTKGSGGCRTVYSVLYTVLLPEVQVGAGQCTVHCTVTRGSCGWQLLGGGTVI